MPFSLGSFGKHVHKRPALLGVGEASVLLQVYAVPVGTTCGRLERRRWLTVCEGLLTLTDGLSGYGLDKFVAVGNKGAAQQQLSLNSKGKDTRPTKPTIAQELGLAFGRERAHSKVPLPPVCTALVSSPRLGSLVSLLRSDHHDSTQRLTRPRLGT